MKRHRGHIALGPEGLELLGATFERARAMLEADLDTTDEKKLGAVRLRLALLVLDLARDGQLGPEQIIATAVRVIREENEPVD